jgi:hypothetical protein
LAVFSSIAQIVTVLLWAKLKADFVLSGVFKVCETCSSVLTEERQKLAKRTL